MALESKSRRCINCGLRLLGLSVRPVTTLEPGAQELLRQWISNIVVSDTHLLCLECAELVQAGAASPAGPRVPREFGHVAACLSCGRSVLRLRTVQLAAHPPAVHDKLLEYAGEFQGSHLDRACTACSRRAERVVNPPPARRRRRPDTPECEPETPETPEVAATDKTDAKQDKKPRELVLSLTLKKYSRLRAPSRCCVVEGCAPAAGPADLHPVPLAMRQIIFIYHQVYIPNTSRICGSHLTHHDGTKLRSQTVHTFKADHIEDMMFLAKSIDPIDFNDIEGMDQHLRKHWMGVSWEEFQDMLTRSELSQRDEGQMALAIYLVGKHSKEGPEVLASIFQIPRSKVEEQLRIAEECLKRKGDEGD